MPSVNLRHSVRAIILDENNRFLLCRFAFPHPAVPDRTTGVWAAPGGGVERGETPLAALRRELHEEVGLAVDADPSHVWHQEVVDPGQAAGYEGMINDYFLIRTTAFVPAARCPTTNSPPRTSPSCGGGAYKTSPTTRARTCSRALPSVEAYDQLLSQDRR